MGAAAWSVERSLMMQEDDMSSEPQPKSDAEETEAPEAGAEAEAAEGASPAEAVEKASAEAELAKMREDLLRALAEIENTRRRGERQAQEARQYAIDRFARDILPVADTLARAIASTPPREELDDVTHPLLAGVEMTDKALHEAFARHALVRVGTKGEAFDPNLHQAVAHAPSDTPAGAVAEVMQPGYVLADRTLRPAMVVVSSGPPSSPPEGSESEHIDIKV
jgi:molecular chaperone GrpE